MRVIYKLVEIQRYTVPPVCPHCGAGLEIMEGYIRKGNNILYQVMKCPGCGRIYTVRKLKEVREEIEEEEHGR